MSLMGLVSSSVTLALLSYGSIRPIFLTNEKERWISKGDSILVLLSQKMHFLGVWKF